VARGSMCRRTRYLRFKSTSIKLRSQRIGNRSLAVAALQRFLSHDRKGVMFMLVERG
jgi:hypothetical protein